MYNVDDDEIIKSVALWLLERQTEENQNRTDPSVSVRSITQLHKFIQSMILADDDFDDAMVSITTSPVDRGLTEKWYNP